ncbi:putative UDP-GlcNAc:betaGal beta-1,3-N-acetylglucosaminyltransferase LOC100288842 [Branchiostoma floridae]|uniref:Hexosyltransferase n=1 Tax=Branchiostoma floridae TaxID=7739 RepID=A0A9J7KQS7_BRAFL|nr:putative UDP-GlcNAc:betaGal beta-1,3-N-acetylglucosaminyltransferase LOC100288842 [Branchiostoma floridae]
MLPLYKEKKISPSVVCTLLQNSKRAKTIALVFVLLWLFLGVWLLYSSYVSRGSFRLEDLHPFQRGGEDGSDQEHDEDSKMHPVLARALHMKDDGHELEVGPNVARRYADVQGDSPPWSLAPRTELCKGQDFVLLALVETSPHRFQQRAVIRRSWGQNIAAKSEKENLKWQVVFVMGTASDAMTEERLVDESLQYNDILQGKFEDHREEDNLKVTLGFQWVNSTFSNGSCVPSFVLKTDDNVLVNMKVLAPWARDAHEISQNLFMGHVLRGGRPTRDQSEPRYISEAKYPRDDFPNFAQGPVYMFSLDVVIRMVKAFRAFGHMTPFPFEDVYLGLLAEYLQVIPLHDDRFVVMKKPKNTCLYRRMTFIYDVSPQEMLSLHNIIQSDDTDCKEI